VDVSFLTIGDGTVLAFKKWTSPNEPSDRGRRWRRGWGSCHPWKCDLRWFIPKEREEDS